MSVKTVRVRVKDDGSVAEMRPTTARYTWDQAVVDQKLALLRLAPVSEVPGVGRRRSQCVFYVRLYPGEYQTLENTNEV